MYWLPAGRGLWAMGTNFVFERGSMALNNCGFTKLGNNDTLSDDLHWMMDALMLGVGVGFEAVRDDLEIYKPVGSFIHYTKDSREGWCESWKLTVDAYTKPGHRRPIHKMDYVRGAGAPILGFGGYSSGPAPLMVLLSKTEHLFETPKIDTVRLKSDLGNLCGRACGNACALLNSQRGNHHPVPQFEDYDIGPEREVGGYMSNHP